MRHRIHIDENTIIETEPWNGMAGLVLDTHLGETHGAGVDVQLEVSPGKGERTRHDRAEPVIRRVRRDETIETLHRPVHAAPVAHTLRRGVVFDIAEEVLPDFVAATDHAFGNV